MMANNDSVPAAAGDCPGPGPGRSWLRRLLLFFLLAAAILALLRYTPLREFVSEGGVSSLAGRLGYWGPLAIFAIGVVSPFLFLPRWPVAVASGMLYGLLWGSALANTASALGAGLHYWLARGLLYPAAERIRQRYKLPAGSAWSGSKVFVVVFLLRALPFSNFVLTNLLSGAIKVRWSIYLAASFFGMIPSTLMYAAVGQAVDDPADKTSWVLAIGLFLLLTAGAWVFSRHSGLLKRLKPD